MAFGVLVLLAVKYGLIGLDAWNQRLHPGRTEDTATERRFGKPLLGLVKGDACGCHA